MFGFVGRLGSVSLKSFMFLFIVCFLVFNRNKYVLSKYQSWKVTKKIIEIVIQLLL